jgi:hypothetical protein
MLGLILPYLTAPILGLFEETINKIRQLTGG